MTHTRKVHVIACGVLAADLRRTAERLGVMVTEDYLPGGLHESPMRLREELQAAIDRASDAGVADRIAIGYGVCGRGTVGIAARNIPLAIPRVHDCIALFLGSDAEYRRQFARYPGTYYISTGWFLEKVQPEPQKECKGGRSARSDRVDHLADKYGRENAEAIVHFMDSWRRNYQRAAFIDTGAGQAERHAEYARAMAAECGWEYEEIPGDLSLLEKTLAAEASTDEVLVVQPGCVTRYDPLEGGLTAWRPGEGPAPGEGGRRVLTDAGGTGAPDGPDVSLGVGIDAGGTYTDVVVYDFEDGRVVAKSKALTTRWDYARGIREALDGVDADLLGRVSLASVSTTLATNAIVEGQGQPVGLLLMPPPGAFDPSTLGCEPHAVLGGRLDIGGNEIEPVDAREVISTADAMIRTHGVQAFAVSGYAGSINPAHEIEVKRILRERTGLSVTCGHELSELLNFRVRAVTAVLNARIIPRLARLIADVERVLSDDGIDAPIMVVKGDGTLMSTATALERPVETVLSGPAASVAGARRLTGCTDALVTDVGGTTTDTASIVGGAVRVCDRGASVGGVRTHVKALEMRTAGLGGDSVISAGPDGIRIGPERVAPVSWAATHGEDGAAEALNHLARDLDHCEGESRPMELLVLADRSGRDEGLTDTQRRAIEVLRRRPHSLCELAGAIGVEHWRLLDLRVLAETGLVQRCGLTPTDLLHVTGDFRRWDHEFAAAYLDLFARLGDRDAGPLCDELLDRVIRALAGELLTHQTAGRIDLREDCDACRAMLDAMLTGEGEGYSLTAKLTRPVIGIGAPVHSFLPQAAALLGAEAIIPPDADVANAVGAITSHVSVSHEVRIRGDEAGRFAVDGLPGSRTFRKLDEAESYAAAELERLIRRAADEAGAGDGRVRIVSEDHVSTAADGTEVFLWRTITGQVTARPDAARLAATGVRTGRNAAL